MKNRIISLALVALIALSVLAACSNAEKPLTAAELLSLGEKFLLDLDYEQAVVHFLRVIEIEPRNPRGYTGAAEAYIGLGEPQRAADILQQGLAAVDPEDAALIQERLDDVLLTLAELADIPPMIDEDEETPEPEPLAIQDNSPFGLIGVSPDELAAAWGAYGNVTQGDSGSLFQYGHMFAAFDRETDGEPDPDGLAYLLIVPLAALVGHESGDTVETSALDDLFGQTGGTEPGVLQYTYQGIDVVLEDVPADGIIPIDHVVILSVEPREPEPEPTPTPAPSPPPRNNPAPTPSPAPDPPPTLAPIPPLPDEDEWEEWEIDLDVLR
jgi:hypothetical protein